MKESDTLDCSRVATEALNRSRTVISELSRQKDIRTRSVETQINTDCILDQSNFTLTSMSANSTLLGRFLSLFAPPGRRRSLSEPLCASRQVNGGTTAAAAIASDDYEAPSIMVSSSLLDLKEDGEKELEKDGDEMKSVYNSVLELKDASLEIKQLLESDAMDLHNSPVATDDMIDKYAINSILITRMNRHYLHFGGLKTCAYSYIGTYRFEALVDECQAPFFLAVSDKKLSLVTCSGDRETAFACFARNDNRSIVAMKSMSTNKFVGIDFLGNVCVAADNFGSYEDLYVPALCGIGSASRRNGGIVVMERHFGRGAWVKMSVPIKATTHHFAYYLNRTTYSIHDKEHRLIVKAYPCSVSSYDYLP